jgi:hypothetical protein
LWTSTSLARQANGERPPADYQFPALNWFRGIQVEGVVDGGLLAIHGEAIMPVETKATSGFQLPGLPFGLPKPPAASEPSKSKAKAKSPAPSTPAKAGKKREF